MTIGLHWNAQKTVCILDVISSLNGLIIQTSLVCNKYKWRTGFSFHNRISVKTRLWKLTGGYSVWSPRDGALPFDLILGHLGYFAFMFLLFFFLCTLTLRYGIICCSERLQRSSRLLGKREMSSGCGFFKCIACARLLFSHQCTIFSKIICNQPLT